MKKKVLFITPSIPPYAGSGVYRNIRFIRHLQHFGWETTILTIEKTSIRKNLPLDPELLKRLPASVRVERTYVLRPMEILLRFRERFRAGPHNQGKSKETGLAPKRMTSRRVSGMQRFKDFLSTLLLFPDAEIGWLPWAIRRGLKIIKQRKMTVLYTSGPPHSCHLAGWALKRLTGLPWVADFRDPWTRQAWIDEATKRTWAHRKKVLMECAVVKNADRVILNTSEMQDDFSQYYSGLSSEKFVAIYNGYDPEDAAPLPEKEMSNGIFTVTHAGSLYKKRTPIGLLRAVSELIREGKVDPEMIRVRLIGRCDIEGIQAEIKKLGLESCVALMGWVTHQESLDAIAESDLLLLIQPGTALQIPGKIFEYIMLKKKILALTDRGATENIVRDYHLGDVAEPMDVPSIKKVMLRFYEERFDSIPLPTDYKRALETFHAHALTMALDKTLSAVMREKKRVTF